MSTVDEVERDEEHSQDFEEIEQDEINIEDIKIELDVGDNVSLHKSELNCWDNIFSQESEIKVADNNPGIDQEPRDDILSEESELVKQEIKLEYIQGKN